MIFFSMSEGLKDIPSFFFTIFSLAIVFFLAALFANLRGRFSYNNKQGPTPQKTKSYVEERAHQVVRLGRDDYKTMLESVKDAALDIGEEVTPAKSILDDEISSLKSEQLNWPDVTDNDRLNAAFLELSKIGYYTGGGMVDDVGTAISEARNATKEANKQNNTSPGYVFYTDESAEDAILGHPVEFWYGRTERKVPNSEYLKIAQDLNSALQRQGFETNWDGSESSQVSITIDWKVRWDEARMQSA